MVNFPSLILCTSVYKYFNCLTKTEIKIGTMWTISSLNQRFFTIKRMSNSLDKKSLVKVADSLFNSKIRYGLQLLGKVKMSTTESQNQDLQAIQLVQNKMIRFLNNKRINDSTQRLYFQMSTCSQSTE